MVVVKLAQTAEEAEQVRLGGGQSFEELLDPDGHVHGKLAAREGGERQTMTARGEQSPQVVHTHDGRGEGRVGESLQQQAALDVNQSSRRAKALHQAAIS